MSEGVLRGIAGVCGLITVGSAIQLIASGTLGEDQQSWWLLLRLGLFGLFTFYLGRRAFGKDVAPRLWIGYALLCAIWVLDYDRTKSGLLGLLAFVVSGILAVAGYTLERQRLRAAQQQTPPDDAPHRTLS